MLNAVVPEVFAIAVTFSGPVWEWQSMRSIAVWTVFGVFLVLWIAQQYFCAFTTSQERALPLHMLSRLDLLPIWIASACAGSVYAVTLIYTPLFFAFARGADALRQSLLLLPFTVPFILTLLLTGILLPVVRRHKVFYIVGSAIAVAGSSAMVATLADKTSSEVRIMGLEALTGVGLGMLFQHGVGICNVINKKRHWSTRVDGVAVCNLAQFGGIAITLAIAGAVFQNVGVSLLEEAIGVAGVSRQEIREALAGVSATLRLEPELLARAAQAVANVISREFYISVAAGAIPNPRSGSKVAFFAHYRDDAAQGACQACVALLSGSSPVRSAFALWSDGATYDTRCIVRKGTKNGSAVGQSAVAPTSSLLATRKLKIRKDGASTELGGQQCGRNLSSGAFRSPAQNASTPRDASRQGVTSSHSTHQTAAVGIRQLAWDAPFTNHTAGLISSVSLARPRAPSHACPRDATVTCGSRQAMCDP
ncbi:hypothetical protein Purlil1_13322 [Purpureocillium lilacinum]|uniref:Uncharacterized protein n=1 Tax=Purpureocillium lilacinum TaxID=33203 RepID=A0ABR0BEC4_PURLI|nr:hypothetical protein Purlil1_13322 [Purpureocillium lilacinum]